MQETLSLSPRLFINLLRTLPAVSSIGLHRADSTAKNLPDCSPLAFGAGPQYEIRYWGAAPFGTVRPEAIRGLTQDFKFDPIIARVPLNIGSLGIRIDIRFQFHQRWYFQKLALGDIASTISLAPTERAQITIKKTQRKYLEESALEEVEQINAVESTIVDKDVVNIIRGASNDNSWRLSLDADFKVFGIGTKTSASQESSARTITDRTINHVRESIRKSSENLKFLEKTQVVSRSEAAIEEGFARVIQNPFNDRSLTLRVFDLIKTYTVSTKFTGCTPFLVLDFGELTFADTFPEKNRPFLLSHLSDRVLLQDMIDEKESSFAANDRRLARKYAAEAFNFLFSEDVRYLSDSKLPVGHENDFAWPFDKRDVSLSFTITSGDVYSPYAPDTLFSALKYEAENIYAAVCCFYTWYEKVDKSKLVEGDEVIRRAIALGSYIGGRWEQMDSKNRAALMDIHYQNEIFRRIPGFLSMVDGLVVPIIGELPLVSEDGSRPGDYESGGQPEKTLEKSGSSQRRPQLSKLCENPSQRVVAHLNAFSHHYLSLYLRYLHSLSHGVEVRALVKRLLRHVFYSEDDLLEELVVRIDLDRLIISETEIMIPMPVLDHETLKKLDATFPNNKLRLSEIEPNDDISDVIEDIEVPADGVHIEPVMSFCKLEGLPSVASAELHIEGLEARLRGMNEAARGQSEE